MWPAVAFLIASELLLGMVRTRPATVPQDVTETPEDVPASTVETVTASTVPPVPEKHRRTVASPPAPTRIDATRKPDPAKVFREELAAGQLPSLRAVKQGAHCGIDRARAILAERAELIDAPQAA
jgi:hypothetical protein